MRPSSVGRDSRSETAPASARHARSPSDSPLPSFQMAAADRADEMSNVRSTGPHGLERANLISLKGHLDRGDAGLRKVDDVSIVSSRSLLSHRAVPSYQ